MKFLILMFLIVSCQSSDGGGDANEKKDKAFFSSWKSDNNRVINLTGGTFYKDLLIKDIMVVTSQYWINELSARGRDITGLYDGKVTLCEMYITVNGDESSGSIDINGPDGNNPLENACGEYDNLCGGGQCNMNLEHRYAKEGSVLGVEYFSNSTEYGLDYLE